MLRNLGKCSQIVFDPHYSGRRLYSTQGAYRRKVIEKYTKDYTINAPFKLGTWLTSLITPGVYVFELASTLKEHPSTCEPVLGFLPLSEKLRVVMMHMSKLFGGNRTMWHLLRAFISLLVHACDKE